MIYCVNVSDTQSEARKSREHYVSALFVYRDKQSTLKIILLDGDSVIFNHSTRTQPGFGEFRFVSDFDVLIAHHASFK